MIEFKTRTHKKKIVVSEQIRNKFKKPLIFFLRNSHDERQIFYTIVLADLLNQELTYIQSYFEDNIALLEENQQVQSLIILSHVNPHCSLQITSHGDFYIFVEGTNFFYRVNSKNNTMQLCFCKDIKVPNFIPEAIGTTCFKDDMDSSYFYFCVMGRELSTEVNSLYYLRCNLDMSDIQLVYQSPRSQYARPAHMVRKFKNYLFSSEFVKIERKLNETGQILQTTSEMILYIYKDLFLEFCIITGLPYSDSLFEENAKFMFYKNEIKLSPAFTAFCNTYGSSWVDIAHKVPKYNFTQLPGSFTMLNLTNKRIQRYNTTLCPAAHIEVDGENDMLYVSSHNFVRSPQGIYYLGPASIDKFKIEDDVLALQGNFSDPKGYRFSSHRVFHYKGKTYIATIGHPNRIFFIDAETMETLYHHDIYQDILSDKGDIVNFLRTSEIGKSMAVAFDVSDDGQFVIILGKTHLYIFSFAERQFVEEIPYRPDEPFENGISLTDFNVATVHLTQLL